MSEKAAINYSQTDCRTVFNGTDRSRTGPNRALRVDYKDTKHLLLFIRCPLVILFDFRYCLDTGARMRGQQKLRCE